MKNESYDTMIHNDPLIYATYERFLLYQYNVETKGLYFGSGQYYIYCPEITPATISIDQSETIHQWLDNNRMIGQWITIVSEPPQGSVRVDDQISKSMPYGRGYLVTQPDINYEVDLLIPNIFPNYEIVSHYPIVGINFLEPITEEGKIELHNIFAANNFPIQVTFTDRPNSTPREPIDSFHETTITFRKARKLVSSNLYAAIEKDEDDWVINRKDVLNANRKIDLLPASFQTKISRGFVNASLTNPDNMRNYLSLFEQIAIVPPFKERTDEFLKGLGITKDELLGLIEIGRVQLLLPNSVEKYESKLVEKALERRSSSVHFTRRINAFTLQEMRRRNPLLFPAISTLEKQILLRTVDESLLFLGATDRNLAKKVIAELGNGWLAMPNAMNEGNVNIMSQFGIVNILDAVLQYHSKKDFKIELMAAAPMVELAAATNSVLMPTTEPGFDLSPFCQIIAEFYSGVPDNSMVVPKPDYTNFAVQEILTISQHVPILEFAQTFHGAEINRFRDVILNISSTSTSPEDLESTIEAFNYFVKQYERNRDSLSTWNIKGFVLNKIGKASGLSYGSWLLKLLTNTVLKQGTRQEKVGSILDAIEGQIYGAYPSSILVSKMKDKIKKKI